MGNGMEDHIIALKGDSNTLELCVKNYNVSK
jgi:hypothetical protein